jgi:hypothetical protein
MIPIYMKERPQVNPHAGIQILPLNQNHVASYKAEEELLNLARSSVRIFSFLAVTFALSLDAEISVEKWTNLLF